MPTSDDVSGDDLSTVSLRGLASVAAAWTLAVRAGLRMVSGALASPYDGMRCTHAVMVQAGIVPRSLMASAAFERAMVAAEAMALGLMARRR
jgi:hypothetical protein